MFDKAKLKRDAFAFSLGGLRTIASFSIAPAIAHDRFNARREPPARRRGFWRPSETRAALDNS